MVAAFFLSTIIILQFYLSFFRVNEFANSCAFDKEPYIPEIPVHTLKLLNRRIRIRTYGGVRGVRTYAFGPLLDFFDLVESIRITTSIHVTLVLSGN